MHRRQNRWSNFVKEETTPKKVHSAALRRAGGRVGGNLSKSRHFLCAARMVTASSVRAVGVSVAAVCGMLLGFYVQDVLKQATLARVEARVAAALRDAPPGPLASGAQPPLAAAPAPAPAPRAPR